MSFLNTVKRIGRTAKEIALAPVYAVKNTGEYLLQDLLKVKESGTPAVVVGGALALATLPFRRIVIPAVIAGRAAKNYNSHVGTATAGFIGGLVGVGLVAFAGELAIGLYVAEAMIMAAKADKKAQAKTEKKSVNATVKTSGSAEVVLS